MLQLCVEVFPLCWYVLYVNCLLPNRIPGCNTSIFMGWNPKLTEGVRANRNANLECVHVKLIQFSIPPSLSYIGCNTVNIIDILYPEADPRSKTIVEIVFQVS